MLRKKKPVKPKPTLEDLKEKGLVTTADKVGPQKSRKIQQRVATGSRNPA